MKNLLDKIHSCIIKNAGYPILSMLISKHSGRYFFYRKYYNLYKKREYKPLPENIEVQKDYLYKIIDFSVKNVPYYKKIAEEKGLTFDKETIFEDIRNIPVLTKDLIRNNFRGLSSNMGPSFINSSSGSTGEPIKLLQDKKFEREMNTLYCDLLGGFRIGDKVLRLWGVDDRKPPSKKQAFINNIIGLIKREKILNTFIFNEDDIIEYINVINKYKPDIIISYVQSIFEISKYILKNNVYIHSPRSIITSAGTLFSDFRKIIERAFHSRVFNRYGSREVGCIAMECDKQEGLHLNIYNHYVEILNDKLEPVIDGKEGELYITLLNNFSMPLIRYKIGDIGIKSPIPCTCGRNTPLMKSILGRSISIFKSENGNMADGEFFAHIFYHADYIERYQIIQNDYNKIDVILKLADKNMFNENIIFFDDIKKKIKKHLSENMEIEYHLVDEIKPSRSSKFLYTISNVK